MQPNMQSSKIQRHRHTLTPEDIIRVMNSDERASLRSQSTHEGVSVREDADPAGPRQLPSNVIHPTGPHRQSFDGRQASRPMAFPPGLQLPPFAYGAPPLNPGRRRMRSMTTPGSSPPMFPFGNNGSYEYTFAAGGFAERANKPECVPQPHNQTTRRVFTDISKENRQSHQRTLRTPSSLPPIPTTIPGKYPRKMGTIRGFNMTKTTDSNDQGSPAASPPINPGSSGSPAKDDSDSIDSLLRNTPMFPGDSQEASSPQSPKTEIEAALLSHSADLEVSGLKEEPLQSIPEAASQEESLDSDSRVFQPLELPLMTSVTECQAEVPKPSNTSTSESLSTKTTLNETNIQESRGNNPSIQGAGNKKQHPRLNQPERHAHHAKQPVAESNKPKANERVGQVKNTNSFGKKNSKSKHSKKGSGQTNKVTKSDMANAK
ncbi:hypothetical protein AA313_de0201155 [Arthrobotrys entomopaga]|nr:hypothetical protein AA313_de0201155 [Arthrobotrys entomopaga]